MFSKTVTYKNFLGKQKTQEFWFHVTKMEFVEMGLSQIEQRVRLMMASDDQLALLREFRLLVEMAAGMRTEDGERFVKTPEAKAELLYSAAYDELLFELCTNAKSANEFINNLIPSEMVEEMKKKAEENFAKGGPPMEVQGTVMPEWERDKRKPTKAELVAMPREEMLRAFAAHPNLAVEL